MKNILPSACVLGIPLLVCRGTLAHVINEASNPEGRQNSLEVISDELNDTSSWQGLDQSDFEAAKKIDIIEPLIDATHPDPIESEAGHMDLASREAIAEWKQWPNAIVYYRVHSRYGRYERAIIAKAMTEIEQKTCIKFHAARGSQHYIAIQPHLGCWSNVGRQRGPQTVSLQIPDCMYHGIVIHELMHALGFYHEQSRLDRDDYVTIKWKNIHPSMRHNFKKAREFTSTLGEPYDYQSIMHYGKDAFSMNRQDTIVPKQPGAILGQRTQLSVIDATQINKLHRCDQHKSVVQQKSWVRKAKVFKSSGGCKSLEFETGIVSLEKCKEKCLGEMRLENCNALTYQEEWGKSKWNLNPGRGSYCKLWACPVPIPEPTGIVSHGTIGMHSYVIL